ncbi:hypothetical protein SDC9_04168 [bioreactor metagenome]|uniref:Bacteriophage lambda Replication protein O N-terminal domain-containing protein n=1 Tax=bioreactor metagenome TaxID=1076179 RepID=A0A644SVJ1_9ZZZZ|nr:helix-turn-helix domain-containing protein [Negativicutes bacterium]
MIIRVQKRDNPYAVIDKMPLNDTRMSFKAKGILSYLLSKPNNWKPSIDELSKASKDSTDAVRTGLQELERFGYMVRKRLHGKGGKIIGWEHLVYETPQLDLPEEEKPHVGKPQMDEPHVENPTLISNELISNDLVSNDLNKNNVAPDGADPSAPAGNEMTGAQPDEDLESGRAGKGKEYSADFLAFWKAYPRKKEKGKAWRVWRTRLREKASAGEMIRAAKNYARDSKGTDDKFIKLAATFIGPDKPFMDYLGDDDGGGGNDGQQHLEEAPGDSAGIYRNFFT